MFLFFILTIIRFEADNWNKLKNMASKAIGEKMKKKEPVGDSDSLDDSLVEALSALSLEQCQGLTVTQIKKIRWAMFWLIAEYIILFVWSGCLLTMQSRRTRSRWRRWRSPGMPCLAR